MRNEPNPEQGFSPALTRLAALAPLDAGDVAAIQQLARARSAISARREIMTEGKAIRERQILLSGWAYRVRSLRDGRRQILGFLLPGDLLGNCRQANPVAVTSVMAMTPVEICPAPTPSESDGGLAQAYAVSGAIDEHYLYRQITRLGRLSALERIADWLLEIRERLSLSGLTVGNRFSLPLTQETIADTLGLTSVHVNRMLQTLRRSGALEFTGGSVTILDEDQLSQMVDVPPVRVSQ
jgi:CRP-like cAMP-binding protein